MLKKLPTSVFLIAGLYLVWLAFIVLQIIDQAGEFVYGLDDAYIHLRVAQNWAETGIMGVNPGEFASASSSPLYTMLLTGIHLLFGKTITFWAPLVINVIASLGLLIWTGFWLQKFGKGTFQITAWLITLLIGGILVPMSLTGMEHLLHAWFLLMSVAVVSNMISHPGKREEGYRTLFILLPLLGGIRYEGLAACFILLAGLFLMQRSWKPVLLAGVAALPVLFMLGYSWMETGFLLPNSVYMKLDPPKGLAFVELHGLKRLFGKTMTALTDSPLILPAGVLMAILSLSRLSGIREKKRDEGFVFFLLSLLIIGLHLMGTTFVTVRYEAYLMILATAGIAAWGNDLVGQILRKWQLPLQRLIGGGVIAVAATFMWLEPVYRNVFLPQTRAVKASVEIYSQQMQMARFVQRYFPDQPVAINDLGLMSYASGAEVIDLEGLGSTAVTTLNREDKYTWTSLQVLMKEENVRMALLYESWYEEVGMTSEGRVATWEIENPYILGDGTVSFFAWDSTTSVQLSSALKAYESQLPEQVIVSYD